MEFNLGQVYFIKDGKTIGANLNLTSDEMWKLVNNNTYFGVPLSLEEQKLKLNNSPLIKMNDLYKKYLDEGYTIVRKMPYLFIEDGKFSYDKYEISTMISKNINKLDIECIKTIHQNLSQNSNIESDKIYNQFDGKYGEDHDYINITDRYKNATSSEVLDIFLRQKTNQLTDQEQEQFSDYRNFDLKKLLTKNMKQNKITNDNAGFIMLTKDNIYTTTCTKEQHGEELKMLYKNNHLSDSDLHDTTIYGLSYHDSNIFIQVCYKEVIVWLPEHLNLFQKNQMNQIIEFVEQLNEIEKNEIEVVMAICLDGKIEDIDINQLKNMIKDDDKLDEKRL